LKNRIKIQSLNPYGPFEMVERKGKGHPDSICDQIAEEISKGLCKYYLQEFGMVLHHNVDKALLVGGTSKSRFGGGKITRPIELILAGRATHEVFGKKIPVEEIAIETSRKWLHENLRFLHEKDVKINCKIRPGSSDLVELFSRFGKGDMPLANDTSFGVAYYPLSHTEQKVIDIEQLLNSIAVKEKMPFIGEDIKVMALKTEAQITYTLSIAMIDRFVSDIQDYMHKKEAVKSLILEKLDLNNAQLFINSADDYKNESVYLTVSGTSAEAGDDGEVGRGNRINGLITPCRPMSMEAVAGKNPISHVGKIYNRFCLLLCKEIVKLELAEAAEAFIVSQIGKPIDEPQLLQLKLKNCIDEKVVRELAQDRLKNVAQLWKEMINEGFEIIF
jgi:S-adenosylmethionine synthetase